MVWWIRFQQHGHRVQKSSGKTRKADALRFLAKALEDERQRQEQGFQKVRLAILCEAYCSQHLPLLKPGTRVGYLRHIQVLKTHFGEDRYVDEIRLT